MNDRPDIAVGTNMLLDSALHLANAGPEYDYAGFSIYTILIPELIKNEIALIQFTMMRHSSMGIAWNMLDAVYSIILGIHQCLQGTHTPIESKIKGSSNVLSGFQLIILTFLGLGAPGFAAAAGLGFMHSAWDTFKLIRCYQNKNIRAVETKKELEYLKEVEKNIMEKQFSINKTIKNTPSEDYSLPWLRLLSKQTSAHLIKIQSRVKVLEASDDDRKNSLKDEIKESLYNTALWGMAFSSMLLVCIPGCQIPALVLIGLTTALYIYKHVGDLAHSAKFTLAMGRAMMNNKPLLDVIGTFFYSDSNETQPQEVNQNSSVHDNFSYPRSM